MAAVQPGLCAEVGRGVVDREERDGWEERSGPQCSKDRAVMIINSILLTAV